METAAAGSALAFPRRSWLRLGRVLLIGGLGFLIFTPLLALGLSAAHTTPRQLARLLSADTAGLILQTVALAVATSLWAFALALPLAWLIVRTDLPGRTVWRWVAALPLAIPSYIGALIYVTLLGPVGLINTWYTDWTGALQGPVNIYGFWGGVFVLGLFTYPYIFLLVAATLESANPALVDTARSLGRTPWAAFRVVTLPLLRPALLAGGLLTLLYALSDFGSLSLLRVKVLTTAIYHHLNTRFDTASASMLAGVLVVLTWTILFLQRRALANRRYTQIAGTHRPAHPVALGRWRWPAFTFVVGVLSWSFFIPLAMLIGQGWPALVSGAAADQWRTLAHSLALAGLAATLALGLGLWVAYLGRRRRGRIHWGEIFQMGYALPGTVLGLAVILFYNTYLPWIYGTVVMVVLAYVIRFLAQTIQGSETALAALHPHFEEMSRGLGTAPFATVRRVVVPLVRPSLVGAWVLVFISAMKELDATLLLRPAGFDTVPVRIYIHTVEAEYGMASALALLLVACTAGALMWLFRKPGSVS
jgi:iron(III) transport system permease protein